MPFCLTQSIAEKIKQAIRKGEFEPNKLTEMTSKEARDYWAKFMGKENAVEVNLLYEKKLLLKNQIKAEMDFFREILGDKEYLKQKENLRQKAQERAEVKKQRIFDPVEGEKVLGEIINEAYNKKYKTEITQEEAITILDLDNKKSELLEKGFNDKKWLSPEHKLEYGEAKQFYDRYIDGLKNGDKTLKEMLEDYGQEVGIKWETNKPGAILKVIGDTLKTSFDSVVSVVGSLDNSFLGRQGGLTLMESPKTWWNMAKKSTNNFVDTITKGKPNANMAMDVIWADIKSEPFYIDGTYQKAGLFPKTEEAYPTSIPERIPVVGRAFKASEVAFVGSALEARAKLFNILAEKQVLDDAAINDIGKQVLAITARGKVGRVGGSAIVSRLLWAPRMIKADWDVLTAHTFGAGLETKVARKTAWKRLASVVALTAGYVAIAEAMGADIEKDPRSSDFLAVKIGNTHFKAPFIRGIPQLVTLFARLITSSSKNTQTGVIKELNTGEFGSKTLFDVGMDYLTNKTQPVVRAGISLAKGRDITGKKPTFKSIFGGFLPITIQNTLGLKDDMSLEAVTGVLLDFFGESTNTYIQEDDWSQKTTKEMTGFKSKVGESNFLKANDEYNKQYNDWINMVKKNEKYINMSDDEKQKLVAQKKSLLKNAIFKKYGYKP